ncbi:transcriptional regulator [Candidatus Woesearchaeota archaeon CG10_big_fil_rev_8_21_14_0_10_34_8]|nr:MAG: transcriptional regulator [Candidatus Woesearchaeota archaeon CG10_big_fil_rev_8_21_14_0_10_34_8]
MICNTYKIFFGTLADETRINILKELEKGSKTVSELQKILKIEQSCVSHCLRKLKEFGFVQVKVKGKFRLYNIEEKTIAPLLDLIDKHIEKYDKHYCRCVGEEKKKRWKK